MLPEQRSIRALAHALVLMARITVRLSRVSPPAADGVEYTNLMVRILIALDATGGCTPSELSDRLGVARSAISRTLRQLHTRGIVSRRVDTKDMRYVRLRLSAKGRRSLDVFVESAVGAVADIEPLVDEMVQTLEVARDGLEVREDATLLEALDELGETGARFVADVLPRETELGVGNATQRFVLWVLRDGGSATAGEVAALLGIEPTRVLAATDQLHALDLVEVGSDAARADASSTLTATPTGAALADAHAEQFGLHAEAFLSHLHSVCRLARRVSVTEG
ncbi:hypothetical protein GCM10022200_01520 [Microbacterium awajiense]|uniref:HTH marR-type domain-containing protein n=1 Tax=Microbacterium awajiense TaxID=415214 RepID=A0ABP7A1A8_9MICO